MKKILMFFMVAIMMISIVGCSETPASKEEGEVTESDKPSETPKEEPKKDKSTSVSFGDEFKTGPYTVTVNSIKRIKDYEGNPAIVINYDWTNDSEDTTSWLGTMSTDVFQDGVQLEVAIITEGIDNSLSMKQVRPGTKLEGLEGAFVTKSETPLEIEIVALEKLFNKDDKVLIKTDYPTE